MNSARQLRTQIITRIAARPTVFALAAVILLGVWIRTYHFSAPIADTHFFRQTQTAGTVWIWDRFGFDFTGYRVNVFGGGHWVLELPTYQTVVFALVKVFGFHEELGRVVSIAAYVIGSVLLYAIGRRVLESRLGALVAVTMFSLMPILVFYYRAFHIDPFTITMALGLIYALLRFSEGSAWRWWSLAAVLLPLVMLTKATIFLAFALPAASLALRGLQRRGRDWRLWPASISVFLTSCLILLLWTRHGDRLNAQSSGNTFNGAWDWYFGSTLTNLETYQTILDRFSSNLQWLGWLLVALGAGRILFGQFAYRRELGLLVLSNFMALVVFANLNNIHDYYQLPWYVALSLLAGLGAAWLRGLAPRADIRTISTATAGVLITLGVAYRAELVHGYFNPITFSQDTVNFGELIGRTTPEGHRVIIVGASVDPSNPATLFFARRIGWEIPSVNATQFEKAAAGDPKLGAVVVIKGGAPIPAHVLKVVAFRHFKTTYDDANVTVFRAP